MVVLTFLIAISMLSCQSNDDYLQIGIGNCESSNGTCPINQISLGFFYTSIFKL